MKTEYHIGFALRHFTMQNDDELVKMFKGKGSHSVASIRDYLKELKDNGIEVIIPGGCDNQLKNGECGGHKVK